MIKDNNGNHILLLLNNMAMKCEQMSWDNNRLTKSFIKNELTIIAERLDEIYNLIKDNLENEK